MMQKNADKQKNVVLTLLHLLHLGDNSHTAQKSSDVDIESAAIVTILCPGLFLLSSKPRIVISYNKHFL